MHRTRKFYERRFRELAVKTGASEAEAEKTFFARASELSRSQRMKPEFALAWVHARLRRAAGETHGFPDKFLCDAGLGGLARWLRGAGYEALWQRDVDDETVLSEAARTGSTLVTTDSLMLERRLLRDGVIPSVWLPSSLPCEEQLAIMLYEMVLPLREARCMTCGGELRRVPKETVLDRIPPRTARWLEEYFVCGRCDRLFWRGTHWQRIAEQLQKTAMDLA